MADNRPMFWQLMDRFGSGYNRNAQMAPAGQFAPKGVAGFPIMRDSQVEPAIDQMVGRPAAYPPVSADMIMRSLMQPNASNGSMADARAQEIAYANQAQNPPGSMADARAQEIAFANSQPNPAARAAGGGGGTPNVPLPPTRPEEFGARPALYNVDFGDGSPVRQFLAKDGQAPSIPGANVYLDQSYDPNAGALAKFIRGAF